MQIVAISSAQIKYLNFFVVTTLSKRFERDLCTARKKSVLKLMKRKREATWNESPATIMCSPLWSSELVLDCEAIPPPMACRTREKKSQEMNVIV
jgi:hypothetical protein